MPARALPGSAEQSVSIGRGSLCHPRFGARTGRAALEAVTVAGGSCLIGWGFDH